MMFRTIHDQIHSIQNCYRMLVDTPARIIAFTAYSFPHSTVFNHVGVDLVFCLILKRVTVNDRNIKIYERHKITSQKLSFDLTYLRSNNVIFEECLEY